MFCDAAFARVGRRGGRACGRSAGRSGTAVIPLYVPPPALPELEAALRSGGVATVASGDVGGSVKLFVSALGSDGAPALAELGVDKRTGQMSAAVRSPGGGPSAGPFLQALRRTLEDQGIVDY